MLTERGDAEADHRQQSVTQDLQVAAMETTEARRESKDILFRRIGVDLPLSEGSEAFSDANAPVRGLAVSNRFGISFFVHSAGERKSCLLRRARLFFRHICDFCDFRWALSGFELCVCV